MKRILFYTLLLASTFSVNAGEIEAYKTAKGAVSPEVADKVVSISGKGGKQEIDSWYITFADPSAKKGARVVTVSDGHVEKVFPADSRPSEEAGVFNPAKVNVPVEKALATARKYAEVNNISYDSVRVQLRPTQEGRPPFWRVELRKDGSARGSVFTKAIDGSFSRYEAQASGGKKRGKGFDSELESTFGEVGGELENFFTGKRTIDR